MRTDLPCQISFLPSNISKRKWILDIVTIYSQSNVDYDFDSFWLVLTIGRIPFIFFKQTKQEQIGYYLRLCLPSLQSGIERLDMWAVYRSAILLRTIRAVDYSCRYSCRYYFLHMRLAIRSEVAIPHWSKIDYEIGRSSLYSSIQRPQTVVNMKYFLRLTKPACRKCRSKVAALKILMICMCHTRNETYSDFDFL